MIEQQLFEQLTDYAGLAALIGDRAYPQQLPQGAALPAVTYLHVSTAPLLDRDSRTANYSDDRYQITGWAATFDAALALRKQIKAAMGTFRRTTAPRVDGALPAGGRDEPEAEEGRFRFSLDYMIGHEEG